MCLSFFSPRKAEEFVPDVIVSDVIMPPPNGFDVQRTLAQNPKTAAIPFIFLMARTAQADKLHGLEVGAEDYITKPFDKHELVARVNAMVRSRAPR